MKTILLLIKKEYILFWNDKVDVSLTFIVPAFLIILFGSIFSGGNSNPTGIKLAFLNQSDSRIANKIESTLDTTKAFRLVKTYTNDAGKEIKFDTTAIKDYVRKGNSSAALVIPKDAYSDTAFGLKLRFYYDPKNEMEMQIIQGLLQQTIMTQIPEIFNSSMVNRAQEYLGKDSGLTFVKNIASVVSKYFNVDTSKILKSWSLNIKDTTITDSASKGTSQFFKNIVSWRKC